MLGQGGMGMLQSVRCNLGTRCKFGCCKWGGEPQGFSRRGLRSCGPPGVLCNPHPPRPWARGKNPPCMRPWGPMPRCAHSNPIRFPRPEPQSPSHLRRVGDTVRPLRTYTPPKAIISTQIVDRHQICAKSR